jgi:hypothetical protein
LSQIQNRTGDRKAAVEMAFEEGLGDRAEVKRLFRHLQQIRAANAEPAEPERVVSLCRQAAESLEPAERAKEKTQAVDLQKRATRSAQEAARHAAQHAPAYGTPPKRKNASKGEPWASSQGCEDNHDPFKSVQVVRQCPVP